MEKRAETYSPAQEPALPEGQIPSPNEFGDLSADIKATTNKKIKRLGIAGTIAGAGALTFASTGLAQEDASSPDQTAENQNPLAEFCDPETLPKTEQKLSTGDTVVFESPAPSESAETETFPSEEATTENTTSTAIASNEEDTQLEESSRPEQETEYDKLFNLINQEEHPECDFDEINEAVYKYYNKHPKLKKSSSNYAGVPENNLFGAKVELDKKDEKKRNSASVALAYANLVHTYAKTTDPKVYTLIEAYIGATVDKLDEKYPEYLLEVLDNFKDELGVGDELPDDDSNNVEEINPRETITEEPTPSPTPELKNINDLLDSKAKPKTTNVTKAIKSALKSDPKAGGQISKKDLNWLWDSCKEGKGTDRTADLNRLNLCSTLVFNLFETYMKTGNEKYYVSAQKSYRWSINKLPKKYRKMFKESVTYWFPTE